ncbi:Signal peptidase complex subunit 2 [Leucoagaricus sp. SymC.cos]|nr:Signal peptidase complex subunit 2 [Leucoagaricus sp. SymC.cos]
MAKDANSHLDAQQRATSEPPDRPTGPLAIPVSPADRDTVKVNNSNITELKNACDDAVKRYLARPELFKQIHLHTDVRLGLGWLSVFVAAGTALYGYKIDFEKSKPVVWFGVILYFALTSIQTLYAYFVEGDTVFVGRRKTFSKRIITERITLSSKTQPASKTKPSSSSSAPNKDNPTTSTPPSYVLSISYVRSANAGKSLLAKGKTKVVGSYTSFFDEQGTMDQEAFEKWVGEAVESAMDGKNA